MTRSPARSAYVPWSPEDFFVCQGRDMMGGEVHGRTHERIFSPIANPLDFQVITVLVRRGLAGESPAVRGSVGRIQSSRCADFHGPPKRVQDGICMGDRSNQG